MKWLASIVSAFMLLILLLASAGAQADADKRNPDLMAGELPWGMKIVFAEGTTITEVNELRIEYGLTMGGTGSFSTYSDGVWHSFSYAPPNNDEYLAFAGLYYRRFCTVDNPCPPIVIEDAFYQPVDEATEAKLVADPRVKELANLNSPTFFLMKIVSWIPAVVQFLLTGDRTGLTAIN